MVLITVTGHKSGRVYTVPVNYLRQGDIIRIVSFRERTWLRNLRGGAPVTLRLRGQDVKGWGDVIEDDQGVAAGLTAHVQQAPRYARYFEVAVNPEGKPRSEDVARAAQTRIVVQVKVG